MCRFGFSGAVRGCFVLLLFCGMAAADPVLSYSAGWGPAGVSISAVATDVKGNVYIAGVTTAAVPLVNALQAKLGTGNCATVPAVIFAPCPDLFVAKLDPTGTQILYSTYLGDNGYDVFGGLAVDSAGNAYAAATSYAPTSPLQLNLGTGTGFVRKLSPDGTTLLYSREVGANTQAAGIAVDGAGNVLVTGTSYSNALPAVNAIEALLSDAGFWESSTDGGNTRSSSANPGVQDAFVTKLNASGGVVWATLLGGSNPDQGVAIAADGEGNAYVTGSTTSPDFPLANAVQSALDNGKGNSANAFLTEISADGTKLVYSTYLGGSGPDEGTSVGVDGNGSAWVTGTTSSPDFPLANPLEAMIPDAGNGSAFLSRFAPGGQKLLFSTFLDGAAGSPNLVPSLAVDGSGNAWVTGATLTPELSALPLVQPIQTSFGAGFVSEFTPGGAIAFSTYFDPKVTALGVTGAGSVWLAGTDIVCSNGFPTVNSTAAPLCTGTYIVHIDPAPQPVEPGVPQVNAIYNAASYEVGDVVASGEIVSIFGSGLAPSAASATGAPLLPVLNNVTVSIGGVPAPLFYVSPGQINLQVPFGLSLGATNLVITANGQSVTRPVRVIGLRPGIFAVTHASDYSLVTQQNPARRGEYLATFVTGLGPTNPSVAAGQVNPPMPAPVSATVIAGFGGSPSYAGLAPGTIGIYQMNEQVPSGAPSGLDKFSISAITDVPFVPGTVYEFSSVLVWVQ